MESAGSHTPGLKSSAVLTAWKCLRAARGGGDSFPFPGTLKQRRACACSACLPAIPRPPTSHPQPCHVSHSHLLILAFEWSAMSRCAEATHLVKSQCQGTWTHPHCPAGGPALSGCHLGISAAHWLTQGGALWRAGSPRTAPLGPRTGYAAPRRPSAAHTLLLVPAQEPPLRTHPLSADYISPIRSAPHDEGAFHLAGESGHTQDSDASSVYTSVPLCLPSCQV